MKVKNRKQMDDLSNQQSIFLTIPEGETRFRIMSDIHAVKEHVIKVEGKNRMIACPTEVARMNIEAGESQSDEVPPCPLCEKGYPVKTSYLAIAINRDAGIAGVLKKGPTVLGKIQAFKDDPDWGDTKKYDVKITRKGKDFNTKYDVLGVPEAKSKVLEDAELALLEKADDVISLEEMTEPRKYNEIVEIIGKTYPVYEKEPTKDSISF